jgi:hypothetical protein
MKLKMDFVTNSSSTSYLIAEKSEDKKSQLKKILRKNKYPIKQIETFVTFTKKEHLDTYKKFGKIKVDWVERAMGKRYGGWLSWDETYIECVECLKDYGLIHYLIVNNHYPLWKYLTHNIFTQHGFVIIKTEWY